MATLVGLWHVVKESRWTVACISALVALSFMYGVVVDRYKVFPYPILVAAYGKASGFWAWIEAQLPERIGDDSVGPGWVHLSSVQGDLPVPGEADQQTAAMVLDIDRDGIDDFVIGARGAAPALVWYRRQAAGWQRYVIESGTLPIEAGGTFHDIDGDGDLDIVLGEDFSGNKVYWWQNPYPTYDPNTGWQRYIIKDSGSKQHHDQLFGDFDGDGAVELAFWNQGARQLYLADIPADPQSTQPWPFVSIFEHDSSRIEGLASADVDQDGQLDLIGGGQWFRQDGEGRFVAQVIDDRMRFTRAAAGQLKAGGWSEVVFVAGDEAGPLKWYEWDGHAWLGHDLLDVDVEHGHSLALADFDQDGNLDVFSAEMHTPGHGDDAQAWIFYGDGQGNFVKETVSTGIGHHESRVADLDGDGDPDILVKPYTWTAPRVDVLLNRRTALDRWTRHVVDPDKGERSLFIAAGDLDADGRKDIVTGPWWYRNPGTPAGPWERRPVGEPLANMAVVEDFDRDGDLDILGTEGVGAEPNADLVWARNDGTGSFELVHNIAPASGDFLQGTAVSTVPSDELQIALSWHAPGNGIQLLTVPSDPSSGVWPIERISGVSQDEALSAGDIDGDGAPDLLLGTKWLRHDPAAGSWREQTLGVESLPDRNRLADIDGDGLLDAVVGFEAISKPGEVVWYQRPEVATDLWAKHVIGTVIGPMSLDVGDLDNDGDIDVVVGEHNLDDPSRAKLYVFENRDGRGGHWIGHVVAQGDEHHDGAILVDIDGDQDLDILSIGWSHNRVLLFENRFRE